MNRREFLKCLSILPVAVLVPKIELEPIEQKEIQKLTIRGDNLPDGSWFITPEGNRFEVDEFSVTQNVDFPNYLMHSDTFPHYVDRNFIIDVTIFGYYSKCHAVCESINGIVRSDYRHAVKEMYCYTRNGEDNIVFKFDGYKIIHKVLT